ILDVGRTALDVTGQSLVGVIVAKREKILDQDAYDAAARTSFQAIEAEQKAEADAVERAESDGATAASTDASEATDAREAAGTRALPRAALAPPAHTSESMA